MVKADLLGSSLTPQEAAVENIGPVDDGTESLGDVPSLSEEVTGIDKSRSVATGEHCDATKNHHLKRKRLLLNLHFVFIFSF